VLVLEICKPVPNYRIPGLAPNRLDYVWPRLNCNDANHVADYSTTPPCSLSPAQQLSLLTWSLAARITVNAPILLVSPLQAIAAGLAIARASVDCDWVSRLLGCKPHWRVANVADPARFARIRALFEQLVELPAAQRLQAIERLEPDPELRARVLSMLDRESEQLAGAEQAIIGLLGSLAGSQVQSGEVLGAWTLGPKLGEGGMGAVFLASRSDGNFAQTVAIKVLRGAGSPVALEYLARERQILAGLAHPNIARLFDGGATRSGQPYLVMEYVEGASIDRYCLDRYSARANARSVDERSRIKLILSLLIAVCDAVSYAHRQLVLHCDLKPSNILVDASGRPLLLDFGIARLLGAAPLDGTPPVDTADAKPAPTKFQARGYTPGFASPEQERGEPLTVAADVFGLGRLLEALLCLDAAKAAPELAAVIRRATASNASARYPSATALSEDLSRYLNGHALWAMPPSWLYRTGKLLRRRWALALAIALFALMGSGFTLRLMIDRNRAMAAERIALDERDRAGRAEASARRISDFLGKMLRSVDPDNAKTLDRALMRSLLDQAAETAQSQLRAEPAALREIETVIGDSYQAISDFPQAAKHYAYALRTFGEPVIGASSRSQLSLRYRQARAVLESGDTPAALRLLEPTLTDAQAQLGPLDELTLQLQTLKSRQLFNAGELTAALAYAIKTQSQFEKATHVTPRVLLAQLNILSLLRSNQNQFVEAEAVMRRAIAVASSSYGALNSKTLRARHSLAVLMLQSKQRQAAVAQLRPLLRDCERALGENHLLSISTLSNLGMALRFSGDLAASALYYQQAYTRALAKFGVAHPLTLDLATNLAIFEIASGNASSALTRIDGVIAISNTLHSRLHPSLMEALRTRARALAALRSATALDAWREVITRDIELYGPDHSQTLEDQKMSDAMPK